MIMPVRGPWVRVAGLILGSMKSVINECIDCRLAGTHNQLVLSHSTTASFQ